MYRALLGHQLEQSKASIQPGEQESGQPQSAGASAGSGKAQQQKKQPTKGGGPTLCVSELMQTQRSYRKRSTVTLKPGDAGCQSAHSPSLGMPAFGATCKHAWPPWLTWHSFGPPCSATNRRPSLDGRVRPAAHLSLQHASGRLISRRPPHRAATALRSSALPPRGAKRQRHPSAYPLNRVLTRAPWDSYAEQDGGGERLGRAEPLLYEWELNTYLLHLVRLQRKQPAAVKVPPTRAPLPAGAQGSRKPKLLLSF
jgi:hypothetical protein